MTAIYLSIFSTEENGSFLDLHNLSSKLASEEAGRNIVVGGKNFQEVVQKQNRSAGLEI